jgi:hypothetical protein
MIDDAPTRHPWESMTEFNARYERWKIDSFDPCPKEQPMKKFGHEPTQRIPLGMLVDKICTDLFLVFAGNGYKRVGFQLVVQNLEDDEMTGGGNLRPEGAKTLLTNALATVEGMIEDDNAANEPKH